MDIMNMNLAIPGNKLDNAEATTTDYNASKETATAAIKTKNQLPLQRFPWTPECSAHIKTSYN